MATDPIAIADATVELVDVLEEWARVDGKWKHGAGTPSPWIYIFGEFHRKLTRFHLALEIDAGNGNHCWEAWNKDLKSWVRVLISGYFHVVPLGWTPDEDPVGFPRWGMMNCDSKTLTMMRLAADFLRSHVDQIETDEQVPSHKVIGSAPCRPVSNHKLEITSNGIQDDLAPSIVLDGQQAHLPDFIARVIAV